jgi:glycosyltransferase involved in cell wall biosynthesis
MVCGTPVVTTRGTDIWQELQEAGAQIADLEPESLANAISQVLAEEDGGVQLGAQGQAYVRQYLDRDHVMDGYEKIYREIIKKGPPQTVRH